MSADSENTAPAPVPVAAAATSTAPVPSPAVIDTMVKIIMGQTEMTHEEVVSALERTNYDLKRVIREYMGGSSGQTATEASSSSSSSSNQLRFSEIRQFMDTSDQMYYRRQEMAKIYNQVLEKKKTEAAATATASKL
jgi:hypothetical protein